MKNLYFHNTGPQIDYGNGVLHIEDLNPHVKTKWRMGPKEMLVLGLRCIWAAITRP